MNVHTTVSDTSRVFEMLFYTVIETQTRICFTLVGEEVELKSFKELARRIFVLLNVENEFKSKNTLS